MNKVWILFKRDILGELSSPIFYILSSFFIALLGYLFVNLFSIAHSSQDIAIHSFAMRPLFGNMNTLFIFILPLFSMRLITEEKKQGTLNLLYLAPLKDWQILLSKFLTGSVIIAIFLGLTLIFPLILHFSGYDNWASIFTGYLGAFVNALSYLSFSYFIGMITRSTVFAAFMGILGLLSIVALSWTAQTTSNQIVGQLFEYLSISSHFEPFSRGAIKLHDLVYFASFIGIFFIMTLKSMDARNW